MQRTALLMMQCIMILLQPLLIQRIIRNHHVRTLEMMVLLTMCQYFCHNSLYRCISLSSSRCCLWWLHLHFSLKFCHLPSIPLALHFASICIILLCNLVWVFYHSNQTEKQSHAHDLTANYNFWTPYFVQMHVLPLQLFCMWFTQHEIKAAVCFRINRLCLLCYNTVSFPGRRQTFHCERLSVAFCGNDQNTKLKPLIRALYHGKYKYMSFLPHLDLFLTVVFGVSL